MTNIRNKKPINPTLFQLIVDKMFIYI